MQIFHFLLQANFPEVGETIDDITFILHGITTYYPIRLSTYLNYIDH